MGGGGGLLNAGVIITLKIRLKWNTFIGMKQIKSCQTAKGKIKDAKTFKKLVNNFGIFKHLHIYSNK